MKKGTLTINLISPIWLILLIYFYFSGRVDGYVSLLFLLSTLKLTVKKDI